MADFCAQPVGQPLVCAAADPCAAGWAKVDAEVAEVDAMGDVRARNKAISASYARLYMAAPELKWAGAAAFASKQVGCGMDTAHKVMQCIEHKPGQAADASTVRGLQQTVDGDPTRGALTMLRHEQQDTLQQVAYDKSWLFRRSLDVSRFTGYPPITFVVAAECATSDAARVVDFGDYSGPLYDFDSRWPFAKACAGKFVELADSPATSAAVNQALGRIAHGAPGP